MSKTTFVSEWVCFQYIVMPFGLKNAPAIFSRIVVAAFKEYIHKFLEVYLDDWIVFGLVKHHIACLCLMLDTCWWHQISLNLKKCTFLIPFGNLLGHVVCKQAWRWTLWRLLLFSIWKRRKVSNNYALLWGTLVTIEGLLRAMHKS